ncbi:hypothetical protein YC2023_015935 [Brassica napus]
MHIAKAFLHPGLGSALGGSASGHGFALAGSRSAVDGLKSTVVGSVSTDGGYVSVSGFGSAAAAGFVGFGSAPGSAGLGSAAASVGFGSAAASTGSVSGLPPSAENVSLPTVSSTAVGSASPTAAGSVGIGSVVASAGHGSAVAFVVPDSGKDSLPPTSSLPSDETIELEEGEILQQSLVDTQLSLSETAKVSMEDNINLASPVEVVGVVPAVENIVPVPSQALVAEVDSVVVQGVLDDIANQEPTLPVATKQGLLGNKTSHEPTLSVATEQVLQIAHDSQESSQPLASELSEVEKTIIEGAPMSTLSDVDELSSDIVPPCDVILEKFLRN